MNYKNALFTLRNYITLYHTYKLLYCIRANPDDKWLQQMSKNNGVIKITTMHSINWEIILHHTNLLLNCQGHMRWQVIIAESMWKYKENRITKVTAM